ncbi:methyltransferase dimerization domain-containing protein [Lentzea sp. NPDC059081]|uniref:methyltransferase family protein n=1 Tax=Lentzea sp. NPDC059081 TaxID=3346719 RepID=UPI003688C07C
MLSSDEEPLAALMRLSMGAWAFKTFAVAVEIGLFDHLATRPGATAEMVAVGVGVTERGAEALLTACAALGLVQRGDAGWTVTRTAFRHLMRGGERYVGDWVRYVDRQYGAWEGLEESLRTGKLLAWDPAPEMTSIF